FLLLFLLPLLPVVEIGPSGPLVLPTPGGCAAVLAQAAPGPGSVWPGRGGAGWGGAGRGPPEAGAARFPPKTQSDPCLGRPGPGARPPCPEQPPRPRRASTGTVAAPPAPKVSPRGDSPSFGRLATPAFVWPREPACHSARSAASTTASGSCASCVSCASAASSPGPGSSTSSPEAPREVFAEAEPALRSARAGPCGGRPPAGAAAGGQSRGLGPFLGGAAPRRAGPPRRRGCDMPGMAPLRALCAERSCLKQRVGAEERAAVFEGSVLLRLEEIRLLGRRAAR
ncbi:unnamed protein product, partial [Prorocentrum cordatum]